MRLFKEVHRRSLWQILGIYLAGGWIVFQVIEALADSAGLPDWVPAFSLVLLLVGLPIVLATAFFQGGGPQRSKPSVRPFADPETAPFASEPVSGTEAATGVAGLESADAAGAQADTAPPRAHHRLFTWKNATVGGVLAFALLGVLSLGYVAMRTFGVGPAASLVAQGVITGRDQIILAEFASDEGDEVLASAATEAFRVDLVQSPVVTLVEPRVLGEALDRMERPADETIDRELAIEIAVREGIKAVITGEINRAGGTYVLSASLLTADSGEELAAFRETASDSSQIIAAIDELSEELRGKIGESLRTIRAEGPLESVTTGSLEALRKYSQGVYALEVEGNDARGITLLLEAVELDPQFAMAYRKLAAAYGNIDERAKQVQFLTLAFEHRDRLTDRERYLTIANYYHEVTNQTDQAITAYENLLELDPNSSWAYNNLGLVYGELRDFARAEELYMRSAALDSSNSIPYTNAVSVQVAQGKYEAAAATLEASAQLFPEDPWTVYDRAALASSQQDYETSRLELEAIREDRPTDLFWRRQTGLRLGAQEDVHGRFRRSEAYTIEVLEASERRGSIGQYLEAAADHASVLAYSRKDPEAGRRFIEEALTAHPLESLDPLDRPYVGLAQFYASAGEPARAAEILEAYERDVEAALRGGEASALSRARADIALAEGRYENAILAYRRSDTGQCRLCPMIGLAEAYEGAGEPDSAIALRERWLSTPSLGRVIGDGFARAPTYERLGRLYDERGDLENAARYYAAFVELWADADPEVQPRVQAAQTRLQEILETRG